MKIPNCEENFLKNIGGGLQSKIYQPSNHRKNAFFQSCHELSKWRSPEPEIHRNSFKWSFFFTFKAKISDTPLFVQKADPPPSHIHTLTLTLQNKETKHSTLECKENSQIFKISDHKSVNKSKNWLTPLKLYSKKHDKK